jgi:hypothetical protein
MAVGGYIASLLICIVFIGGGLWAARHAGWFAVLTIVMFLLFPTLGLLALLGDGHGGALALLMLVCMWGTVLLLGYRFGRRDRR